MAATSAVRHVRLEPARAWALWTDLSRWATFVEGFSQVVERSGDWPAEGSKVVWQSTPGGRGRVTEKVTESRPAERFGTRVFEEQMSAAQLATFARAADGRTRVELALDYELTWTGPLRVVADVLFIRRAVNQALGRTLARFATEAEEEAAL
jgi:uncharacterized membrane protein